MEKTKTNKRTQESIRSCRRWLLLVIEPTASRIIELPETGELLIGRDAPPSHVRLTEPGVSRQHARLSVEQGEVHITDLKSHNGTLVNDWAIELPRALMDNDEIGIGNVKLILMRWRRADMRAFEPPRGATTKQRVAPQRRFIHNEIQAAAEHQSMVSLLYAIVSTDAARRALIAALEERLGPRDQLDGEAESVQVVMPGADCGLMLSTSRHVLSQLGGEAASVRIGCASFPVHAADADGLLATAREAGLRAEPAKAVDASVLLTDLEVGSASVLIGDRSMRATYDLLRRLATSELSVLIQGETGTGKELAARALHGWSLRTAKPLVSLNCAAVNPGVLESELFGHVKGAFTGAVLDKIGVLESASGGTLFLDEIGEMPTEMQAKLLRAIENQLVRRVGEVKERAIDVRIIAATHSDLILEMKEGRFRPDLYYRLKGARVHLPPLRQRPLELAELARRFLNEECRRRGRSDMMLSTAALLLLRAYGWPGNVRELKNVMTRAAIEASPNENELLDCHLPEEIREVDSSIQEGAQVASHTAPESSRNSPLRPFAEAVRELERKLIKQALEEANGEKTKAAQLLRMSVRTFYSKLEQYGLGRAERDSTQNG